MIYFTLCTRILNSGSAERTVNERLEQTPEVILLALTQFATSADTEVVRVSPCEGIATYT